MPSTAAFAAHEVNAKDVIVCGQSSAKDSAQDRGQDRIRNRTQGGLDAVKQGSVQPQETSSGRRKKKVIAGDGRPLMASSSASKSAEDWRDGLKDTVAVRYYLRAGELTCSLPSSLRMPTYMRIVSLNWRLGNQNSLRIGGR